MKIVFVSQNKQFLKLAAKKGFKVFYGVLKDYYPYNEAKSVFYVSPINAYGFMEYSTDLEITEMFPDLQERLFEKIQQLGYQTQLQQRKYLPIGKAVATECKSFTQQQRNFVISSPICLFPQNVSKTRNVYYLIISVLQLLQKYDNYISETDELVFPAIGCNDIYGFPPEQSFDQMMEAFSKEEDSIETLVLNYQEILYKQPRTYGNMEFGLNLS